METACARWQCTYMHACLQGGRFASACHAHGVRLPAMLSLREQETRPSSACVSLPRFNYANYTATCSRNKTARRFDADASVSPRPRPHSPDYVGRMRTLLLTLGGLASQILQHLYEPQNVQVLKYFRSRNNFEWHTTLKHAELEFMYIRGTHSNHNTRMSSMYKNTHAHKTFV